MNLPLRSRILLLIAGLLLTAGLVNYYLLQKSIELFRFLGLHTAGQNNNASIFLVGYFSDFFWCAALYCCVVVLAERKLCVLSGHIALLLLPFLVELLQYLHILPGTADVLDILLYSTVLLFFTTIFPNQILRL